MPNKITRALLSVSDKSGLAELGAFLDALGIEILSTGGSAGALRNAGVKVTDVSSHTGFPEIMDGRVKTLHPKIHGGILARRDLESHRQALEEQSIGPIDLVVVNLYPFEATLASGANFETCIENIDIGGPAMVRASAKNHSSVTIVTDPSDYQAVMDDISANNGVTSDGLRRDLAAKAFGHTAAYDAMIAGWLDGERGETFPLQRTQAGRLNQVLRYGENPHQMAALYVGGAEGDGVPRPGIATAQQLQGKELSYNNLNDTDAAFELVAEFEQPAVAIIKHANPCGVAMGEDLNAAYVKALSCDPVSAFGGIIALNRPLDAATAEKIAELFAEVVIAPEVDPDARAVLAGKKNLRVLTTSALPDPAAPGMTLKTLAGGFLLQSRDNGRITEQDLKVVTKRAPDAKELADMVFAFRVAKHVKSNAIVYAREGATVGIGAGQMSRVDSSRIAAWKAREAAEAAGLSEPATIGAVVASDAFFPFADGLMAAVDAGAKAVIQPGGSMRDDEVIAAADEAGLAMVFTGMRHFRH
ncbi:bifunctional phosphoribosylaminoimidazolecarboxamide formyltransferase/IMP cyclohydrolase [Pelagibius sp. Alg239-R121]|uniref:bifunctional phosphoribosylaminoimidazolecarboxamide formyltransferase/IMP cyclohydrolase n=1 Tax=Pelagibius sp. Alg239-R121 TaxID=2993448 RepID=UPI0024A73269|nr:bifunctional phosphoribosylaminoimidazolecarboxamide formyltransferase/IMP cyclohydrolase [Pelagibius sp. Alg239-R121]